VNDSLVILAHIIDGRKLLNQLASVWRKTGSMFNQRVSLGK
jgi:hypothetical protein